MNNLEKTFGEQKLPSILENPFLKSNVIRINVVYRKSPFKDEFKAFGFVEFQNNKTKGEQKFKGETFDEVVLKIKAFLTELK